MSAVRILGIDPGLGHTGWGVIECDGNRLRPLAHGAPEDGSAVLALGVALVAFGRELFVHARMDPTSPAPCKAQRRGKSSGRPKAWGAESDLRDRARTRIIAPWQQLKPSPISTPA